MPVWPGARRVMQADALPFQALTRACVCALPLAVLALDLGALYCLGCAALYGYRAYNDQARAACACAAVRAVPKAAASRSKPDAFLRCAAQGIDPAVLGLSDQQLKRLGLTPPPPGAGRPPLGAADNGLRRRTVRPHLPALQRSYRDASHVRRRLPLSFRPRRGRRRAPAATSVLHRRLRRWPPRRRPRSRAAPPDSTP